MKKRILLTTLTLILFVIFAKAQDIKVSTSEEVKSSNAKIKSTEVMYLKIEGLKSVDDAKKIDVYLKTFDYVVNANTDYKYSTCTIEAKVGYMKEIIGLIRIDSNKIFGYSLKVRQTYVPQGSDSEKSNSKN
jgi:hypothetical protein